MKMPNGFKVIGDKALLMAEMEAAELDGGIVIPDTCRIHDWTADVVQIGDKCVMIKPGDKVLYQKSEAVIPFSEAQEYRIAKERSLIAWLVKKKGQQHEAIFPLFGWLLCKPEEIKRSIGGIHLPDRKINKAYGAKVVRVGADAEEYKEGETVYFDTLLAIECFENDEKLCLTSKHDIICRG
jgi:co-chaperonin GroES (HSP10)